MTDFKYCHCPTPDYFQSGTKRYCRHCWCQEQPVPPPEPEPPTGLPPFDVLGAWVAHSHRMGMDAGRIARDLHLSVPMIEIVLKGGV